MGDEQVVVVLENEDDGFAASVGAFLADDDVERVAERVHGLCGGTESQQEGRGDDGKSEVFHVID